jgi:hypothetical protein
LALILSVLALVWCTYLHHDLKSIKNDIKRIESMGTEKIIYTVLPKKTKPDFGRISKGE